MRILVLSLALALAAPFAAAQEASGRYDLIPVEGGALRLDTQTGFMSFCAADPGGASVCTPVRDGPADAADASALEARLADLEARLAALEAAGTAGTTLLPDDETMDRVMVLTDRMMRRFFGLVRELQKDVEGEAL